MRQGVLLVLQAVAVELLVAVGAAATQGLQGGRGAAARDGRRAGGVVLSQTLLLKASHDLDIGEILQLVAHGDGVVRGAELTVYGRLRAQGRLHA